MIERNCTTPYKPEVQGPLDLSHFEAEQTNKPILSPPDSTDLTALMPLSSLPGCGQQAAGYQVQSRADLFAVGSAPSEVDEFGDDFYFT